MINKITYNLENKDYSSVLKDFSNLILNEANISLKKIIADYEKFLDLNYKKYCDYYINKEIILNHNEYILEAILLGVLWKNYINSAILLDPYYQDILVKLNNLRDLDDEIDQIRGKLVNKHLLNYKPLKNIKLNNENLKLLLDYLEASGDYTESLKHLNIWKCFLDSKSPVEVNEYLEIILSFTEFFKLNGEKFLHKFTSNVCDFIDKNLDSHINNEDIIFISRTELEYHLNMFASEIMNNVFKNEFHKRNETYVFLPICMKIKENKCRALNSNLGLKCISCNEKCNIGKISKYGIKENLFKTYIVEHSSKILLNYSNDLKNKLSIIGVACINNLIEGGWKLSSNGIPAQCISLDYVCCKNHWNCDKFSTNCNKEELYKLLNIIYEK